MSWKKNWFVGLLGAVLCTLVVSPGVVAQGSGFGSSRPLPDGRQFHGSAVLGDYLYVFGGFSNTDRIYTPSVLVSSIDPDNPGTLGPWKETTPMLQGRGYIDNSTLVLNDIVYVIGGSDDIEKVNFNTAIYARPGVNGELSRWLSSEPFGGGGVTAPAAFATPGYLHVTGGALPGEAVTDAVWSAPVEFDGTVGKWVPGPRLPKKLWYHNAAVAGGRAYIWGGLTDYHDKVASADVYSAEILSSGTLGAWRRENPLATPFYGCPTSVAGDYLISFCPRMTGGYTTKDAWFSQVGDNQMTPWRKIALSVPMGIYHSAASDYRRNTVYVIGGRQGRDQKEMLRYVNYFVMAGAAASQRNYAAHYGTNYGQSQYSYSAGQAIQTNALSGFLPIEQARQKAAQASSPLVVYFNAKDATPCVEQNAMIKQDDFQALLNSAVFAWVDILDYPQLAQQYGVYRVPTWVVFDKNGSRSTKHIGKISSTELREKINLVK